MVKASHVVERHKILQFQVRCFSFPIICDVDFVFVHVLDKKMFLKMQKLKSVFFLSMQYKLKSSLTIYGQSFEDS